MGTWIRISQAIVTVVGIGALLLSVGNLLTGGGSITDPVMPGGIVLGLLAIGAGVWTADSGTLRAVIVWLGIIAILGAAAIAWVNVGDIRSGDLLIYVGIPTLVTLIAVAGVVTGRVRAGPLGA
jgi:hypothetical protein